MTQQNVEVVKQALDAYTRRDVEALRAIAEPNMELDWSASRGWLAGVYRGIDDALGFYAGYFEAFEEIVIEPDRFIEAGDSVVVPNVAHQRGRDGIEVSARSTLVFTVRSRRITRICLYQETEEALKAVGLAGQAMSQANVEIAKKLTAALNRLDVDAWAGLSSADFEWFPVLAGTVQGRSFRGRDGIEEYFGQLRDTWEEFRLVIDEFVRSGARGYVVGRRGMRLRADGPLSVRA